MSSREGNEFLPAGISDDDELMSQLSGLDLKKALLDARRPLSPEALAKLKEYFDIEWTHHSTAIEGNTLTLQETAIVLKHGLTVNGKSLKEHLEIVDHKKAIDFVESLAHIKRVLTESDVQEIHRLVTEGLDYAAPGRYRTIEVRIGGSQYLPPPANVVPQRMKQFVAWLGQAEVPDLHPVSLAAKAHLEFVTIHPFVDGNGRAARLLQNLLLMRRGFPPAVIAVEERQEYYRALQKAQMGGSMGPLVKLVARATERSLDIYLGAAGGGQMDVGQ